ncbi:relaxase/mobilization nuclease domain-containing protein [Paraflavisolibacter sp. H34]|uniref:relaxase/mobilization nuclease domain-containing protein n=1 Tax=Huijunlia imazamoxiresistens TaxID=3127457 RepID=UPI003019A054
MIAAIRKGKYIKGAVDYNERKVAGGVAQYLGCQGMIYTQEEKRGGQLTAQLTQFAELNKNVERPVFHTSLNSPPGQVLTPEQWMGIAADYMKAMGFGATPYAVYRHGDRGHDHIHIVSVLVDGQGKRISDSHDRRRSQDALDSIVNAYGLLEVPREKEIKGKKMEAEAPDLGLKSRVALKIEEALRDSRSQSLEGLRQVLQGQGVSFLLQDENRGKPARAGQKNGIIFFIIDDHGRQASPGLKGSSFLQNFSFTAISKALERNQRRHQPDGNHYPPISHSPMRQPPRESLKANVYELVKKSLLPGRTLQEFADKLEQSGVGVKVAINAKGIYGISFIHEESGEVFKASELSRDLSWNKIKDLFSDQAPVAAQVDAAPVLQGETSVQGRHLFTDLAREVLGAEAEGIAAERADVYPLPYTGELLNTGADTSEEDEEQRRRKRRKKGM